jgi:hypothetical protein
MDMDRDGNGNKHLHTDDLLTVSGHILCQMKRFYDENVNY